MFLYELVLDSLNPQALSVRVECHWLKNRRDTASPSISVSDTKTVVLNSMTILNLVASTLN